MFGKRSNPVVILDNYEGVVMAEVYLTNIPKFLESAMLKETDLKQRYNVIILLIKRDEGLIEKINGEIRLKKNDTLVVFGERKNIRAVFEKVEDKIEG